MSDETRQEKSSVESTVGGAAKTGKAIANIAKGAAVGGAHGAAIMLRRTLLSTVPLLRPRRLRKNG